MTSTNFGRQVLGAIRRDDTGSKPVADVWIVLVEDRHASVDALPFSSEEEAVGHALTLGAQSDGAQPAELTTGMRAGGWVLYIPYGSEGDKIRVVKRIMDSAQ
jgi:hypothetical protein